MNDPGLIRTFTKQVREVYPFIVPNEDADADVEWVFYYGDGTPTNEDEYNSWAAFQAFMWNGGEIDRSHDVDYTEGDTPNDIVDFDVEDTGEVDATRFSLIGCYKHDPDSSLFKRKIGNDMSPGDCFAETKANGYMYAAMTTGKQCYASNELESDRNVTKGKDCDTECKYTSSMVCGGPNQEKSVYQVDKLTADTRPPNCN